MIPKRKLAKQGWIGTGKAKEIKEQRKGVSFLCA